MTITIKIDTGNDAFQDGNLDAEVGRILARVARDFADGAGPGNLYDINGNRVGTVTVRASR
jgi:hypothetical protein